MRRRASGCARTARARGGEPAAAGWRGAHTARSPPRARRRHTDCGHDRAGGTSARVMRHYITAAGAASGGAPPPRFPFPPVDACSMQNVMTDLPLVPLLGLQGLTIEVFDIGANPAGPGRYTALVEQSLARITAIEPASESTAPLLARGVDRVLPVFL